MTRENERANRRFAVIRGKRARPVASARAKVEVLESIKDAIKDESESSDSSEADDEGDGEDDDHPDHKSPQKSPQKILETPPPAPPIVLEPARDHLAMPPTTSEVGVSRIPVEDVPVNQGIAPQDIEIPPSVMGSPMLSPTGITTGPMTPPPIDIDIGPSGRPSILKALSGLWPQQAPLRSRAEVEADDPMADPEHIFRDSSMVVRTDEPTSIIALALK